MILYILFLIFTFLDICSQYSHLFIKMLIEIESIHFPFPNLLQIIIQTLFTDLDLIGCILQTVFQPFESIVIDPPFMYFFNNISNLPFLSPSTFLFLIEYFFLLVFVLLILDFIDIILYQLISQWFISVNDIQNQSFLVIFLMDHYLAIEWIVST